MISEIPELDEKALEAFAALIYSPPDSSLTEEERKAIKAFVESHCKPRSPFKELRKFVLRHPAVPAQSVSERPDECYWRNAAAKPGEGKRPSDDGETIYLVYVSLGEASWAEAWRATLTLPANPTCETVMALEVLDREGNRADGVFRVAGVSVALSKGRGAIPYRDFVKGVRDSAVSLTRQGGRPVPGTLALI